MNTCCQGGKLLGLIAFVAIAVSIPARADPIFNIGSSFTVVGTNSPNNFTETVTLNPGMSLIDNGALIFTQAIVDKPNGEWLVMDFQTSNGNDIAGIQNSDWELQQNTIKLVTRSDWTERYTIFGTDGVLA